MVGVTGSIPVAPTISFLKNQDIFADLGSARWFIEPRSSNSSAAAASRRYFGLKTRIDFSRRFDVAVTKELLNLFHAHVVFRHVHGGTVPEHVGRYRLRDASRPGSALDAFLERANALARPFDDQLIRTIASTKYQSGNCTLIKRARSHSGPAVHPRGYQADFLERLLFGRRGRHTHSPNCYCDLLRSWPPSTGKLVATALNSCGPRLCCPIGAATARRQEELT